MFDVLIAAFPIVLLIFLMTKANGWPAFRALPLAALLMLGLKLVWFHTPLREALALVVTGSLTAWTPILIIWGAVFLFQTMERGGGMDVIRAWLNGLTVHPVAQVMIVAWSFQFLIEGASGFGTPVALAAPILVGMGFDPVRAALVCLVMNSAAVSFGAVGTPTWFGFREMDLSHAEMLAIGFKTALLHSVSSLVVPVLALRFIVPWRAIGASWRFIALSLLACLAPYVALARFTYEFPALVAGLVGLVATAALARAGVGLGVGPAAPAPSDRPSYRSLLRAAFPLWATALILIVTRMDALGIKALLTRDEPFAQLSLGPLGQATVSPSLMLGLRQVFGTDHHWRHALLYSPSLIPFFAVSLVAFGLYRMAPPVMGQVWNESWQRMRRPVVALMGGLILVKLLMEGGDQAPSMLIGRALAQALGEHWRLGAPWLGALGAFFSGSNTVSNLTFGPIQYDIALTLGADPTTMLALQSVGGAMGNMTCLNPIVAVCSVLGISDREGAILRRTIWPMLLYGAIAVVVGLMF